MRKIPTLFQRDPVDRRHVLPTVSPGCEWVLAGEGVATMKIDGTCVMLDEDGEWWARREVKPDKATPPNYVMVETDSVTGKQVGWEPVAQSSFAKFHAEALHGEWPAKWASTYELVGPKINGNPHGFTAHGLLKHGDMGRLPEAPRDFDGLRAYLLALPPVGEPGYTEGIVWWRDPTGLNPDAGLAKLKIRDFA